MSNFDFLVDILVADMASFAKKSLNKSRNNRSNLADSNANSNTKKKGVGFVEIYIGDCTPAPLQPKSQPPSQTPKLQKSRPPDIEYESDYKHKRVHNPDYDYDDYNGHDELQYGRELYYCDDCEDKGCNQCARN